MPTAYSALWDCFRAVAFAAADVAVVSELAFAAVVAVVERNFGAPAVPGLLDAVAAVAVEILD